MPYHLNGGFRYHFSNEHMPLKNCDTKIVLSLALLVEHRFFVTETNPIKL